MKITRYLAIIIWLIILGCETQKEIESKPVKNIEVKKTNQEIKISKGKAQRECFDSLSYYKSNKEFELVKLNIYRNLIDSTFHYSTCDYDGTVYLRQLDNSIDIDSVEDLGEYWVDKNNVYSKYSTSDGIQFFKLKKVNRESFKTFGKTIYAKDKVHVFDSRHGIIEGADLETFKAISINKETGMSVYGKDRYNYFFWDEIVEDKDTIMFKKSLNKN